ncbi:NAD nucleotidase [Kangiella shandongensis]|uniref:NAD nucleotidase n=1 Tax=Kangiella shandongensis TaxID=2763258 RepID=UPI001CBAFB47|nr:NAD nucleotidase [Kangiella shandongensis]
MNKRVLLASLVTSSVVLAGCPFDSDDDKNEYVGSEKPDFSLGIVHINDHHSHLDANSGALEFSGVSTDVDMGGFPRVVAKIKELTAAKDNSLKLHAGDAITGDLFYTLFAGEADASLMNQVCFDAFSLGNHEFDAGDEGLKTFLDYLSTPVCDTAVLAANVVPEVGVSALAPNSATDYFKPYTIKEFGGERVGIIGIDIADKTKNSSSPDETTEFLDEQATAQQYIDELQEMGVNKIVVMTHYQYQNDIELAKSLSGVDVIVGGDSHTLLGDFTGFGLNTGGDYPTVEADLDGNTVCIVQAWEYSNVVGELDVVFDGDGNIKSCDGTPHLLIGDSLVQNDVELEGTERQQVIDIIDATPQISIVEPDLAATQTLENFASQVDSLTQQVIGAAAENLCLERVPGQGKSALCDVSETAMHGSDISNIVALAFKEQSIEADIAIQNGGGVRIDVPAGDITVGTAYTLLPFANTLVNLDMTGEEIKQVLEEAVDYATTPGGSTGAYPYASGLRFDVDLNQAMGSRISNLEVKLKGETEWTAIDLSATYKVVTNDFIASGKDGYVTFGTISEDGRVEDTYLDYAQSFVDYVKRTGTLMKLPYSEYSTQNFTGKQ